MTNGVERVDVAASLRAIGEELSAEFQERNEVVTAMLCTILAREHMLMLGPPGTGKSMLCRAMVMRLIGIRYFDVLLSRQRQPEDVMGPLDLLRLQATGEYVRRIKGYLLDADIAFLDEIGKMGPVLGHNLLAALNERIRHEVTDAGSTHAIPLSTAFTASNEIPTNESDDASALYDRLLVRVTVDYIEGKAAMFALLSGDLLASGTTTVAWPDVQQAIREVPSVKVPDRVVDAVLSVRESLRAAKVQASDRRWRQSMRLMQAHAYLHGRDALALADLRVLDWTLWSTPDQRQKVRRAWQEVADPLSIVTTRIFDEISGQVSEMRSRQGESIGKRAGFGMAAGRKLKALERELDEARRAYEKELGDAAAAAEMVRGVQEFLTSAREEIAALSLVED